MDEGLRARSRGSVPGLSLGHGRRARRDARRAFERWRPSQRDRLQTHGAARGEGNRRSTCREAIAARNSRERSLDDGRSRSRGRVTQLNRVALHRATPAPASIASVAITNTVAHVHASAICGARATSAKPMIVAVATLTISQSIHVRRRTIEALSPAIRDRVYSGSTPYRSPSFAA